MSQRSCSNFVAELSATQPLLWWLRRLEKWRFIGRSCSALVADASATQAAKLTRYATSPHLHHFFSKRLAGTQETRPSLDDSTPAPPPQGPQLRRLLRPPQRKCRSRFLFIVLQHLSALFNATSHCLMSGSSWPPRLPGPFRFGKPSQATATTASLSLPRPHFSASLLIPPTVELHRAGMYLINYK